MEKERHNLNRPVHFVTYFYLFQYHQQLMSCGTSQNAYADAATKMNSMLDQGQSLDRRVLRKAYEIFIHALNYDMEKAWGCARCPRPLGQDEHELDFDGVIEVHIADGINMGTSAALKESMELFTEEKVDCPSVRGITAKERTFLAVKSERVMIEKLVASLDGGDDRKKISLTCRRISNMKTKSHNLELVGNLLNRLKGEQGTLSSGYQLLLDEIWRCTPISQLLASNNKQHLKTFESYIQGENDCFATLEGSKSLTEAFPFPVKILRMIQRDESRVPADVLEIFQALIDLKRAYTKLAEERAMPRRKPKPGHKAAESEVYPFYPLHTMEYAYDADKADVLKDDGANEEKGCNKDYNESCTISGGITHVTCEHSITKGFTAMRKGESPMMAVGMFCQNSTSPFLFISLIFYAFYKSNIFSGPCTRRLPARVRASHRYLLYDNACQARKGAELRFPHRVRNWTFLVDRKHWPNHTTCSKSFNIDEFPQLKHVNSQISEQLNRSLRKLNTVCAYLGWDNYLRVLELFLINRNWDKTCSE